MVARVMLSALLAVLLVATAAAGKAPENAPAPTAYAVQVQSPNGGELWTENVPVVVRWEVTSPVKTDSIRIRLTWEFTTEGEKPTTGSRLLTTFRGENPGQWTWEKVGPVGEGMKIQVEAFFPEKIKASDASDNDFAVVARVAAEDAPVIVVLNPNGGEKWTAKSRESLLWEVTSKVEPDSIRIRLTWKIAEGVKDPVEGSRLLTTIRGANEGKWEWEDVGPVGEGMRIRVEAFFPEKKRASDTSDDDFMIVP